MNQCTKVTLTLVAVFLCVSSVAAQNQIKACEASKLYPDKSAVYVSFDHTEDNQKLGEAKRTVWLRLHNNTKCNLSVPIDQRRLPTRLAKDKDGNLARNTNGGLVFEPTDVIVSGSKELVIYDLLHRQKGKAYVGNIDGDVIESSLLNSGANTLFSVVTTDIRKDWALFLLLHYEGNKASRDQFHVYFDFNGLPSEVQRNKNPRK